MDTQGRQQSNALSFHRDTRLSPPSITGHNVGVPQQSLPALLHQTPAPPVHLLGEDWVAEPSQAQPSRRVMQAAAGRDISTGWPLGKLGLHKCHRQDRHQPPPRCHPSSLSSTSRPRPRGPSGQTGGGEHEMTTSCHRRQALRGRHQGRGGFQPLARNGMLRGGGSRRKADVERRS